MSPTEQFSRVLREWTKVFMHRSAGDFKRFLKESGLSVSHLIILMRLHHGDHCGVSEISHHLGISSPAASQAIDRLVQMGALVRREDPHDRRAKQLALSDQGKQLIEKLFDARTQWIERLTDALSDEQQGTIIEALTLLTEAARKTDG